MDSDLPPLSDDARSLRIGLYRHYKGGMYDVLGVARHSETLEELVVYRARKDGSLWLRPLGMFLESMEVDGRTVQRFERTGAGE